MRAPPTEDCGNPDREENDTNNNRNRSAISLLSEGHWLLLLNHDLWLLHHTWLLVLHLLLRYLLVHLRLLHLRLPLHWSSRWIHLRLLLAVD